MEAEPDISWTDLTKFVGQLNHDLRNHLNAVELQVAFLGEIVSDPEAKDEIKRLREMTADTSAQLERLSAGLAPIQPNQMRYLAAELVEDLRTKLTHEEPELASAVEWKSSLGEEALKVDPYLLEEGFLELFCNAAAHGRAEGRLVFEARREGDAIEFILREPKTEFDDVSENWGSQPFARVRSGHYGLGLFRARSIFEAHHGSFRVQFDSAASTLVTTVFLPLLAS
jgi:light-regulated signal transduction histidine kinase (bacteriophytochrome)